MESLSASAYKNDIHLSEEELVFSYNFIKNHYREILKNPASFDFKDYAGYYSEENFIKISKLINKYRGFLG